jgi:hypothetical protein
LFDAHVESHGCLPRQADAVFLLLDSIGSSRPRAMGQGVTERRTRDLVEGP